MASVSLGGDSENEQVGSDQVNLGCQAWVDSGSPVGADGDGTKMAKAPRSRRSRWMGC